MFLVSCDNSSCKKLVASLNPYTADYSELHFAVRVLIKNGEYGEYQFCSSACLLEGAQARFSDLTPENAQAFLGKRLAERRAVETAGLPGRRT